MKGYTRKAYTLPAMAVTTIEFNGVNPNYFRVNNGGDARIYGGVISLPTPRLYDFKVEPNQVRMYCTDKGYPKLYLYNASGTPANVIVSSFIEAFSPEVLAFADFNTADNEEQTLNVEIGGFTQSLPTGQNHIGKVTVTEQPDALYTALTEIKNKIGTTDSGNIILGTDSGQTKSGRMGTIEAHIKHIDFITNDSEDDLTVTFYNINGTNPAIVVKGGEVINDIDVELSKVTFTSDSDNLVDYRMVYTYIND